jgi:hypothetical protein
VILDDLADYLSTSGVTTPIFRGFMPEKPNEAIQLLETGGQAPRRAMGPGPGNAVEEVAGLQVIRRSPVYQRARIEMNVIWKLLDGLGDYTQGTTRYRWIEARQSPFPLGRDESDRTLIACNFLVAKHLSTSTSM